jgi:integrase
MPVLQEKKDGKVVKTKDGRSWFFKTTYKDLNGNIKQIKSKKYELKRDAEEAERIFLISLTDKVEYKDMTFKDLILDFDNSKKDKVKITSYSNYKKFYKLLKDFDNIKLKDFNITHFNKWKDELNKKDYSTRYKNNIYKFLRTLLNYAVKYHEFNFNQVLNKMTNFTNPNELKKEMLFWTYEEYSLFIKEEKDIRYKTFFETLYYCGLRKGEANALTWKDIDFDKKTISINKNLTQKIKGEKYIVLPTKTKGSNRILPLTDKLVSELVELKEYYKKYKNFSNNLFVFGGIAPLSDSSTHAHKDNNVKKANEKLDNDKKINNIRIHDFRHSCASLLISKGANISLVSKYLGHSNISTTLNTYTHMFKSEFDDIVKELNKL